MIYPSDEKIKSCVHTVYILETADGRYYTGYTTNLERRFKQHATGMGAKFTNSFGVTKILYHEAHPDKSSALRREAEIKSWSRQEKKKLISQKS